MGLDKLEDGMYEVGPDKSGQGVERVMVWVFLLLEELANGGGGGRMIGPKT